MILGHRLMKATKSIGHKMGAVANSIGHKYVPMAAGAVNTALTVANLLTRGR